jgi:signal-transduction protein with cAMP-binding, CBS, and nucleotidyltransferase domain
MSTKGYVSAGEVMTPSPKMIQRLATVSEAIDLMREHTISSLVIDRRDENDEYGLLVVTDIATKLIAQDRSPDRTNVYEIMSKPVLCVDRDMDIKYAIRLLARFGISRTLVTEGGSIVGIVTLRDMVLRYMAVEKNKG